MSLQNFFIVCVIVGVARSEPPNNSYGTPLGAPINNYGASNYDANNDHHDHGEPMSYEFGYQVKDEYSGNNYNRKEASDGNQVHGEYRVQLPDGRTQIVTYYADWQTGFHADVRYEGTAQYPEQYNGPSNQFGGPSYPNNTANNGYTGGSATSSVSIKDYATNGYNNNFDSYSNNFGNKGGPGYEYGAP